MIPLIQNSRKVKTIVAKSWSLNGFRGERQVLAVKGRRKIWGMKMDYVTIMIVVMTVNVSNLIKLYS